MPEPKILVWDIEATSLNATFGTILCVGYMWHGDDYVTCPTIRDYPGEHPLDDGPLVQAFSEVYEQADYTVAHYGKRYDLPMIQTVRLREGMGPLPPIPMIDTWRVMKDNFKFHSNRLAVGMEFLDTKADKTPIKMDDWKRALFDDKALSYVVDHCFADVEGLDEFFTKIRPYCKEPSQTLFTNGDGCVSCGSTQLHKRGWHVALTRKYQRYQCQDCGKWQRSRSADKDAIAQTVGSY